METKKIVKELERRGLQYRGEIAIDDVHKLNVISKGEIKYEKEYMHRESYLYFAKRKAKDGRKVGEAGTECMDILISVDKNKDDTECHIIYTHSWFIPSLYSKENPVGVFSLELDDDCHIVYCSSICGCCSSTGYCFDEVMQWSDDDKPLTAFDAVAKTPYAERLDLLPETCKPTYVRRFGYRD